MNTIRDIKTVKGNRLTYLLDVTMIFTRQELILHMKCLTYFKGFSYNWRTMKPITEALSIVLGNSLVVPNYTVVVGHTAFNRGKG